MLIEKLRGLVAEWKIKANHLVAFGGPISADACIADGVQHCIKAVEALISGEADDGEPVTDAWLRETFGDWQVCELSPQFYADFNVSPPVLACIDLDRIHLRMQLPPCPLRRDVYTLCRVLGKPIGGGA